MNRKENLKAIQLFAGFDDEELAAFVDAADRRSVPADHVFFGMGTFNSSLFVIIAGSVKIDRFGSAEDIPLAVLGAGQTFGEMSFMDGSRTTATVTASELTDVLQITREAVDQLLDEQPNIAAKLWRNFSLDLKHRLTKTNELIDQYIDINQVLLQDQSLREYYHRL